MIKTNLHLVMAGKGIRRQKELADLSGIPENTISRISSDKYARIDKTTLNRLCRALECQPGDLLEYVPDDKDA